MKTLKELLEMRSTLVKEAGVKGIEVKRFDEIEMELRQLDLQIEEARKLEAPKVEPKAEPVVERTQAVNAPTPAIVMSGLENRANAETDLEKRMDTLAEELRAGKEVSFPTDIAEFVEKRMIASSSTLIEKKYKREVEGTFNEISQVIDLVKPIPLEGGADYSVAFAIDTGSADYSAEAGADLVGVYTNSEGTFGTNTSGRAKVTNSAIVNEEVIDLPNANYLNIIYDNVRKSIRKKISNQIIAGTGDANTIKGIVNAPVGVMPAAYYEGVGTIGVDTLLSIVMAYGNDEDVESPLTLFLNKTTLASFAKVKKANGDPNYQISYNGPSGVIECGGLRVPYSITSALTDHATATNSATTMLYGDPQKYEMLIFGDIVIKQSNERYIEKGQIGFFGRTYVGGLVSAYKAFLPIKKA